MFLQFPHGLLYGFESLWCFFTNTGRMAWGQGWRKPVKSSVIQAGRCCGHYPLSPLAPLQLLSTKCSQTGVGGHLSKIWYAEPKGLALLSASETSSQRTLEYCLCSVLLIIYARQQRGCPPSDQLDESLLWHEALSLSVLLPEISVRFSSSWASEKGKIIERWSFLRTDYSAGHFTAYWMRDLEPVINCSDPQHLLWNGDNNCTYLPGLLWESNKIMQIKPLTLGLAQS